eukprot:TRINITY_DN9604_c0_g1_i1.p1 TRINITY_DN9604_c0_g1~~TRINITY_DN9604_c0_g1_i1.p1  ORF type:complete len:216 (+),score=16.83 TRINITY_DN9604_c0_g1_i1:241-888(+)
MLREEHSFEVDNKMPNDIPGWVHSLQKNLDAHAKDPTSRYLQMATVDKTNTPHCRTVVFRGFLGVTPGFTGNELKFVTDLRSAKFDQIQNNTKCEICWYFEKTREQFRVAGDLKIVSTSEANNDLSKVLSDQWKSLSDAARGQFAWPPPGSEIAGEPKNESDPDPNIPLNNFGVLLLLPNRVDHLTLKGYPQKRTIYSLNTDESSSSWSVKNVNP